MAAMDDNLARFLEKSAAPTPMKSTENRAGEHWAKSTVDSVGLNLENFAKTVTKWRNYLFDSLLGLRLGI
jgi:hypothetical protein